jgi:glutamate N-acetyltransferase/amino-acid N-acetyltransferase
MEMLEHGSVTTPDGFTTGVATCGLKESGRPDLMLLHSERDCTVAGMFTRNQVVGAPVTLNRETLAANSERVRAIATNSGIANACTGAPGLQNARRMQSLVATALRCRPEQVLVLSTGVIGVQLPMAKISAGLTAAAADRQPDGGPAAARAIMTTDTRPKHLAVRFELPDGNVTIGGIAKGSGMIHPNMATMLAFLTTDAVVPAKSLRALLKSAVDKSFNRISIDGDTSTSDTVLLLANGVSGLSCSRGAARAAFSAALTHLATGLAHLVVRDGEGVTKFVSIRVSGARTKADAHRVANTIATSPLVKTAFAGSDPNWGRIIAAAGRAGVRFDLQRAALWIGASKRETLQLVARGAPCDYQESEAAQMFAGSDFSVHLDLGCGDAETTVWTGDLTREYVSINADYRT